MRVVFIIMLVILGIFLALPYWFGMNTEKEYEKLIKSFSEAENITVVDESYKRGWLSSKAQTTFAVTGSEGEIFKIHDEDTIYHGPIPLDPLFKGQVSPLPVLAVIDSKAALIPTPDSEYEDLIRGLPPLIHTTVLSLNGGGTTEINMPGVESKLSEDDEYFTWSGLKGTIKFEPGFKDMVTSIESTGLAIKSEDLQLTLNGINVESDIRYEGDEYYLPLGTGSFNVEAISVSSRDKETGAFDDLRVKNISFEGSIEDLAGTLTSVHRLGVEEITVGELTYGPGGYKFALRNIDKSSWKNIQRILKEARDQPEQEDQEESNEYLAELMGVLPELVRKSPELEISDLIIETGEGDLRGNLFIAIDGTGLTDPDLALNPLFLLAAITANAELSVTKTLLEDAMHGFNTEEIQDEIKNGALAPMSDEEIDKLALERTGNDIGELTSQNILVLEGDRYVLNAEYKPGQILLNGNPLDLGTLLGL